MGKPTHGSRQLGYFGRMVGYFLNREDVPRGQVRREHGGRRRSGMMDPGEVINKIAKDNGNFTPEQRNFAEGLIDRF